MLQAISFLVLYQVCSLFKVTLQCCAVEMFVTKLTILREVRRISMDDHYSKRPIMVQYYQCE